MLDDTLTKTKEFIPAPVFSFFQPAYHFTLSFLAALRYGFPSRSINVIAVTGTKGKSSTVEILSSILEQAGWKTALSNTIRFKIDNDSRRNLYKMSMPGRFAMQKLIREAVNAGCDYFVCEMTSQGSLLFRHKFIGINTLIFTNLSPEHIEAHGSYERYVEAKVDIARGLARSGKRTTLIVNADEKEASRFLACRADKKIAFSLKDAEPYKVHENGMRFTFEGHEMQCGLSGIFNLYNILAASTSARNEGVPAETIASALELTNRIPGRVERIELGQSFTVVVDYAHTADSLEKLYRVFDGRRKIAVLGGTGGGRDTSKRAVMGGLADKYCAAVIITNEDPYDEDPDKIMRDVASGVTSKQPVIILDRREAIREAFRQARPGDAVLITGKGTDPYIMGAKGSKIPWSDTEVATEELQKILK